MKKLFSILSIAAALLFVAACEEPEKEKLPQPVDITVQLTFEDAPLAIQGIKVALVHSAGTASYEAETDAAGKAAFSVLPGVYNASATYKTVEDGVRFAYNGSNGVAFAMGVDGPSATEFKVPMQRVESQQIIIKELYSTGCQNSAAGAGKTYSNDAYVILYNNSEFEADASDIVFGLMAPSNAHATNKFYVDNVLVYDEEDWIPAYSALWWFTSTVKIPAYSQIVVAIFGAIDHTATVVESVNLSNASYYWMSNGELPNFKNAKYAASENIPAANYLTGVQINQGNAWVVSNNSPGFYIGKMAAAEAKALGEDTGAYDTTQGSSAAMAVAKFPKANVVDAVDVWSAANVAKSLARFSADINTGYVTITNNQGHSIYRNVDKEATEALEENADKLVRGYAGDPSGIDAEASIAAGAHIIFSDTNDSGKDFHEREVASLKK